MIKSLKVTIVRPTSTCNIISGFTVALIDENRKKYHETLHNIAKRRLEAYNYVDY